MVQGFVTWAVGRRRDMGGAGEDRGDGGIARHSDEGLSFDMIRGYD